MCNSVISFNRPLGELRLIAMVIDVNRKDYRAWYGLGQAYELLSMHQYALYYYQHATSLRCVLNAIQILHLDQPAY